jgi:hypothetical protein
MTLLDIAFNMTSLGRKLKELPEHNMLLFHLHFDWVHFPYLNFTTKHASKTQAMHILDSELKETFEHDMIVLPYISMMP